MSKIYNWDTKKTKHINLSNKIKNKYFFKDICNISDVKKIFKNSYLDFKKETIYIDQFSEIANILWGWLMKNRKERNKTGDIILMVSEINFYLNINNLDRVDDILDEVQKYFNINKSTLIKKPKD